MYCKPIRFLKKNYYSIKRSKDTPHRKSLGIAFGLFFGVAIPIGQLWIALLFAIIFKANKVSSVIATFISNPYTSPFLYPFLCWFGSVLLKKELSFQEINKFTSQLLNSSFSWETIFNFGNRLIISYSLGGVILGSCLAFSGYLISYKAILLNRQKINKWKRQTKNKWRNK